MNEDTASERTLVIKRDACECTLENIIHYRSEKEKYWEESELLYLIRMFSEVLAQIHEHNFCHRDLIPVKILYSLQDSCYKISEWTQGKDIAIEESELVIKNSIDSCRIAYTKSILYIINEKFKRIKKKIVKYLKLIRKSNIRSYH